VRAEKRRLLRGDDPKDPISDADAFAGGGTSKNSPQVIIRGLPGSQYHSPPRPTPAGARGRSGAHIIDSEDSMDDLSVGHYKVSAPSLPDKRKLSELQSAKTKKDVAQAHTISDTSDEEIDMLEKGNIKPVTFPASKKAASKEKKLGQDRYQVLQVFSPSHTWFLGDSKKEWFLVYSGVDGLLSIEGEDAPPLSMGVNSISIVEYTEECSKMTVHKSRDNSFRGATHIHITLTSPDHSIKLAKQLASSSTIKAVPKARSVFCMSLTAIVPC
jgi:hypothetical protein